jgi:hypothetical protein
VKVKLQYHEAQPNFGRDHCLILFRNRTASRAPSGAQPPAHGEQVEEKDEATLGWRLLASGNLRKEMRAQRAAIVFILGREQNTRR